METYVIIPRSGTYRVMAAEIGGNRTLVAVYPTEQAAVARLRDLQSKVNAGAPDTYHTRYGRL
jgi:hypothetical protein